MGPDREKEKEGGFWKGGEVIIHAPRPRLGIG